MPESPSRSHQPSEATLRWVAQSVGAGARVRGVAPLAGATSSSLHAVEVEWRGRVVRLVLRRFVSAEWLASEPDLATHEAASLRKASGACVPTPELIAFDATGDVCGFPTTLMTRLPGAVELQPPDFAVWLHRLAAALVPVHALDAGDFAWDYYPYTDIARLAAPVWSRRRALWERAIEIVAGARPATRVRFIHRDYHPNNVVWQRGVVSGVVDWVNACRGAAGIDVAWCRQNLTQLYGVAAADKFLESYQTLARSSFEYHPFWDLIALVEVLPDPGVYEGWSAFGIVQLTADETKTRLDDYLASIMARF